VALSFLAAGDVTDLGSDHFDMKQRSVFPELGVTTYDMGFGGHGVMRYDDQTESEAIEFAIMSMLDEGELLKITGLFTENGYHWAAQFKVDVGGEVAIRGRDPRDVSSLMTRNLYEFTKAHYEDLLGRLDRIPAPSPRRIEMTIEGRSRQFDYWRLVYPDFGPVEYYITAPSRSDRNSQPDTSN